MKQYVLNVVQNAGGAPSDPRAMDKIGADVDAVNAELMKEGRWVFGAGLLGPEMTTVVRVRDGEILTTDGPFAEGKEYIGGFWVINAEDLDEALEWARKATRACQTPIEVRPTDAEVG